LTAGFSFANQYLNGKNAIYWWIKFACKNWWRLRFVEYSIREIRKVNKSMGEKTKNKMSVSSTTTNVSRCRPVHYNIHIEPDLKDFRFSGTVEISVNLVNATDAIVLNALDLAVWRSVVEISDHEVECTFRYDPDKENLTIFLPSKMEGVVLVRVDYEGRINNNMAGFYRSQYHTGDGVGYVAVTQFQESDARRAFPCFDHPSDKATFTLHLVIDSKLTAVSNTPVAHEESAGSGKKRICFHKTPVMSSYLVFFGVGLFDWIEDPGDILVRVVTTPGLTRFADLGLAFGRKAFSYCQDYFSVDYPLKKLDLIAIEDFAAGAMENWGAMTFRENLLLQDPETTSRAGQQRICEVIAHETAHQWFGDLVSPADWRYLWLNESFATYFGFGVVDHYYPQWDVWSQFLYTQTGSSMLRDGLHHTCAIEIAGGEHIVINASTAPIIYSKGASVLRQVEGYIGPKAFKDGLRHYLKTHAFDCASSEDLWKSLQEVSDVPVADMMHSWIYEPGHPVVTVNRKDCQLLLSQKRFTFLPNDSDQTWTIPVAISVCRDDGSITTLRTLMGSSLGVVDMRKDFLWYKVNAEQIGFYRVCYEDKENLERLKFAVLDQALTPSDRWGLQADIYAQVLTGEARVDDYLQFLRSYEKERAYLPIAGLASNLFHAFMVCHGSTKERISSVATRILEKVLADMGFVPSAGEAQTTSTLRDQILRHTVVYQTEGVRFWAKEKFKSLMAGEKVHPDVAGSVMQAGAMLCGHEALAWFEKQLQRSRSEHERLNILDALGSFEEHLLIEKALQFTLEHVPERNKFVTLCSMAQNPKAIPMMWEWFVAHIKSLETLHPVHFERVIASVVPVSGLGKEKAVKSFFEKYLKKKESFKDVIALSLEKLAINSRLRTSGS
jgi:tricorn protease interacting factor F2/3